MPENIHSMKTFRMLNLGDSYTIGESVLAEENFPNQLCAKLKSAGIEIAKPEIIAKTGWTTDELLNAVAQHSFAPPYKLVTLLIGVNNQYRDKSIDEYRIEFRSLLDLAIIYSNNKPDHVLVISIPDWGVMPFAEGRDRNKIATEIDAFNKVNYEEALKSNCEYCNITSISRHAGIDLLLVADDGLHPSPFQYSKWVDSIFPLAKNILVNG